MFRRIIFFGLIFSCFVFSAHGQGAATKALNQAEDDFDKGRLSVIPNNLSRYFKSQKVGGFSNEEKIQAYRLITLVHIYNDDNQAAEDAFIQLMKADPEHPPLESDPKEFHFLHKKFNTDPIFRLGFRVVANRTQNNVLSSDAQTSIGSNAALSDKSYAPAIGLGLEVSFEYPLPVENLELILGVSYMGQKFTINSVPYEDYSTTVTENQSWWNVPLMARYSLVVGKGTIIPYVYGGGIFSYLAGAKMSATRTGGQSLNVASVSINELRNAINLSATAGVGLKLKSKTNFFALEVRYVQGLNNIVNSDNRFNNITIRDQIRHVDDNFSQNYLSISFGYIKSFYNPKKYSEKKYNKKLLKSQ